MKRWVKASYFMSLLGIIIFQQGICMASARQAFNRKDGDSLIALEIQKQLNDNSSTMPLYFPGSVKRYYQRNAYHAAWIKPQSGDGPAWQAMLMIDCVLQFGLSHDDYHPKELLYSRLHDILDTPEKTSITTQARFDIMLTDGIITFMNNLHYGKLNPEYPADKIDRGGNSFQADAFLPVAFSQKNLMSAIASVQPRSKEYEDMQYHMRLLAGQYQGDCYEVPEAVIRKIAINMERLRWAEIEETPYIQVNIPSYTLRLYQTDSTYTFKVITGKPTNPTPTLQSAIGYFTTAPEWKVPRRIFVKELLPKALANSAYLENNHLAIYDSKGNYVEPNATNLALVRREPGSYHATQSSGCDNALGVVVFRFPNRFSVYLHDTPEPQLFNKEERDLSHGCVRVEHAKELAALLLKYDGAANRIPDFYKAIAGNRNLNFNLKSPVAIKITYLTCEVKEGIVITYKDIYNLDKSLEMALYNVDHVLQ